MAEIAQVWHHQGLKQHDGWIDHIELTRLIVGRNAVAGPQTLEYGEQNS